LILALVVLIHCRPGMKGNRGSNAGNARKSNAERNRCLWNVDGKLKMERIVQNLLYPTAVAHTTVDEQEWLFVATSAGRFYLVPEESRDADSTEFQIFQLNNFDPSASTFYNFILDPEYPENDIMYVLYTRSGPSSAHDCASTAVYETIVLASVEYNIAENTLRGFTVIATIDTLYNQVGNNPDTGGGLVYLDGKIYFGIGVGNTWTGATNPGSCPTSNGATSQDDTNPRGKIYQATLDPAGLITWAKGVKQPFSMTTEGSLVIGNDCGAGIFEEVNVYKHGLNYGFGVLDGPICAAAPSIHDPVLGLSGCGGATVFEPAILSYTRYYGGSCSTGSSIYQGNQFPCLRGKLIVTDLTIRDYADELAKRLPTPLGKTHGNLYWGNPVDRPAWENDIHHIQIEYPTEAAIFFRLATGSSANHEIYIGAGSFAPGNHAVYKLVGDEDSQVCSCGKRI